MRNFKLQDSDTVCRREGPIYSLQELLDSEFGWAWHECYDVWKVHSCRKKTLGFYFHRKEEKHKKNTLERDI